MRCSHFRRFSGKSNTNKNDTKEEAHTVPAASAGGQQRVAAVVVIGFITPVTVIVHELEESITLLAKCQNNNNSFPQKPTYQFDLRGNR